MKTSFQKAFDQYLAHTSPEPLKIEIDRAEGLYLFSPCGKRYLDLIAGIAVCNVGHSHPDIVRAVKDQAEKYMHLMVYGELVQQPQVALAELLVTILPETLNSVFFVNSGSEAVEGALKLARRYTQRKEILYFEKAYHGATNGSMSVMGSEAYRKPFEPLLPETKAIKHGCIDDLEKITQKTAAIIVEIVQGEAGVQLASREYWQQLRARCTETETLLIVDEIQSGLGRTGKCFAFEHYGIVPDILLLAKALGGGMPLGAFIANREVMNTLTHNPVLGHITTFGGHPVSCAAALTHLRLIVENKLWENAEKMGEKLKQLFLRYDGVTEVRHLGLMMAVEFNDSQRNFKTIQHFLQNGIFTDWFLWCDTALRVAPPLTFSDEHFEVLEKALK